MHRKFGFTFEITFGDKTYDKESQPNARIFPLAGDPAQHHCHGVEVIRWQWSRDALKDDADKTKCGFAVAENTAVQHATMKEVIIASAAENGALDKFDLNR